MIISIYNFLLYIYIINTNSNYLNVFSITLLLLKKTIAIFHSLIFSGSLGSKYFLFSCIKKYKVFLFYDLTGSIPIKNEKNELHQIL